MLPPFVPTGSRWLRHRHLPQLITLLHASSLCGFWLGRAKGRLKGLLKPSFFADACNHRSEVRSKWLVLAWDPRMGGLLGLGCRGDHSIVWNSSRCTQEAC